MKLRMCFVWMDCLPGLSVAIRGFFFSPVDGIIIARNYVQIMAQE